MGFCGAAAKPLPRKIPLYPSSLPPVRAREVRGYMNIPDKRFFLEQSYG